MSHNEIHEIHQKQKINSTEKIAKYRYTHLNLQHQIGVEKVFFFKETPIENKSMKRIFHLVHVTHS